VSIDDSGKDLLELTGIGSVDCGFLSRPSIMMLIKTLRTDEMWLGKKHMQHWVGGNGVFRAD
jgi:hypothetical protein